MGYAKHYTWCHNVFLSIYSPLAELSCNTNSKKKMNQAEIERIRDARTQGPHQYINYLCRAVGQRNTTRVLQKAKHAFVAHCGELFDCQRGRCALSGLKMTWHELHRGATQISIDRVDGERGYEIGNVRLVCVFVNHCLENQGDDLFYHFMALMDSYTGPPSVLHRPTKLLRTKRVSRSRGVRECDRKSPEDWIWFLCVISKRAKNASGDRPSRSPQFVAHCIDLYYRQGGECALTGVKLTWGDGRDPYALSMGRIFPEKGLVIGNVQLVARYLGSSNQLHDAEVVRKFARAVTRWPRWSPPDLRTRCSD